MKHLIFILMVCMAMSFSDKGQANLFLGGLPQGSFSTHLVIECVDKQLKALQMGEIANAYRLYTSEQFRKMTSFNDFSKFIETNDGFKAYRGVHLNGVLFQEDRGVVNAILRNSQGEPLSLEYMLVRDDKTWRIHRIEVHSTQETQQLPISKKNEDSIQKNKNKVRRKVLI